MEQNKKTIDEKKYPYFAFIAKHINSTSIDICLELVYKAIEFAEENELLRSRVNELENKLEAATKHVVNIDMLDSLVKHYDCTNFSCENCFFDSNKGCCRPAEGSCSVCVWLVYQSSFST